MFGMAELRSTAVLLWCSNRCIQYKSERFEFLRCLTSRSVKKGAAPTSSWYFCKHVCVIQSFRLDGEGLGTLGSLGSINASVLVLPSEVFGRAQQRSAKEASGYSDQCNLFP